MTEVYFPIDAVVALVVPLMSGPCVETAMIGRDGAVGANEAANDLPAASTAVVRVSGKAIACSNVALAKAAREQPGVSMLIARQGGSLLASAHQTAACVSAHLLAPRFATWLLHVRLLAGRDMIDITQEEIAELLGVRRTSVSVIAHDLRQRGAISHSRGRVKIGDVAALASCACECHRAFFKGSSEARSTRTVVHPFSASEAFVKAPPA